MEQSSTTPQMPEAPEAAGTPSRISRLKQNIFLKHVLTLMTGTAVAQLIPLVGEIVLSRMYDDHQYGLFTLYMALASGIMTLGALRYDMAVVVPEKESDARGLVKLASRLALGTSLLATLVLTVWAGPLSRAMGQPDIKPYLPLVGLLALAMTQISSRQYWLNRRQRYKDMARNRMGQAAGTTGTQIVAGVVGLPGAWGLVLGPIVGQWFSFLNLRRLTRHETRPQPGDSALAMAKEHRKMPLLNGPNALVDTIRLQGINVMIGMFFSGSALGQFSKAWRLLQMPMGLINQALSQVFFQKLATTPRGRMFGVVRNAIVRSLAIGIVPFGLIWLLSPWLFPFVLGDMWRPAGDIARILVPWLYLNFVTSPISTLFITVRRQGVLLIHAIFYAAVPLGLIWRFHSSLTQTLTYVSWSMAGLLVVFLLLALMVARQFDRGIGSRQSDAAEESGAAATTA